MYVNGLLFNLSTIPREINRYRRYIVQFFALLLGLKKHLDLYVLLHKLSLIIIIHTLYAY